MLPTPSLTSSWSTPQKERSSGGEASGPFYLDTTHHGAGAACCVLLGSTGEESPGPGCRGAERASGPRNAPAFYPGGKEIGMRQPFPTALSMNSCIYIIERESCVYKYMCMCVCVFSTLVVFCTNRDLF